MLGHPRSGFNLHAEYTVSGLPWATSSFASSTTPSAINFEKVTRDVTVSCVGPTTGSSLRVGFTQNGVALANYFLVEPGTDITFHLRIRDLYVMGHTVGTSFSVCASLTTIDARDMQQLSGTYANSGSYNGNLGWPGIG